MNHPSATDLSAPALDRSTHPASLLPCCVQVSLPPKSRLGADAIVSHTELDEARSLFPETPLGLHLKQHVPPISSRPESSAYARLRLLAPKSLAAHSLAQVTASHEAQCRHQMRAVPHV